MSQTLQHKTLRPVSAARQYLWLQSTRGHLDRRI